MRTKRDPVTDLLRRARGRISDPARWTRGESASRPGACTAERVACSPRSVLADRGCAVGALLAEEADGLNWMGDRGRAYNRLYVAAGAAPEEVNDRSGHAAVLAMYDAAIRGK